MPPDLITGYVLARLPAVYESAFLSPRGWQPGRSENYPACVSWIKKRMKSNSLDQLRMQHFFNSAHWSLVHSYYANANEVHTSNANAREVRHAGAVQVLFPRWWTRMNLGIFLTSRLRFSGSHVKCKRKIMEIFPFFYVCACLAFALL